jgi:hypothetical protein
MTFGLISQRPHLLSRNLIHERLISQSILSVPTDHTHRDFSSSDLRDVQGFPGARFGANARGFPEHQIQLIGIEPRVFDDLADLEPNGPFIAPIADAARQMGFRRFGQKFVQLGNSVPKSPPKPVANASRRRRSLRAVHRPSRPKPNQDFHQTEMRLTTRRSGDMAPVRKKAV